MEPPRRQVGDTKETRGVAHVNSANGPKAPAWADEAHGRPERWPSVGASDTAPVTVVIPCYRCSSTIERAIMSVAHQSLRPAEVIVVEDASGDSTLTVLAHLQKRLGPDWIRVVALNQNRGPGNARNVGWGMASNPFIAFLDADDSWTPDKVEIQYRWMADHPGAALSSHRRPRDGSTRTDEELASRTSLPWRELQAQSLVWRNVIVTSAVMLRRDIEIRFPPERRYSEDYWLWLQIAFAGGRVFVNDAPLARTHKADVGGEGLSGDLWRMQRGQLKNYQDLRAQGHVTYVEAIPLLAWSLVRYLRTLTMTRWRKRRIWTAAAGAGPRGQ